MHESIPPCYVFTTLRYHESLQHSTDNCDAASGLNSPIYLLSQHHNRLQDAANAIFGADGSRILTDSGLVDALQLQRKVGQAVEPYLQATSAHTSCPIRVRLQINPDAAVSFTFAQVQQVAHQTLFPLSFDLVSNQVITWTAVVDLQPTKPSLATQYKTHDRVDYDRARSDAGIHSFATEQEVLLYDTAGNILDASITTPYFFRDGHWITPIAYLGGQRGTTRSWALSRNLCLGGKVHINSLLDREVIWLSNAARGFFKARVQRHTPGE